MSHLGHHHSVHPGPPHPTAMYTRTPPCRHSSWWARGAESRTRSSLNGELPRPRKEADAGIAHIQAGSPQRVPGGPQTEGFPPPTFHLEEKEVVPREAPERPRERPAEPWAGGEGRISSAKGHGSLHSFTVFAPASSPLKGPYSSLGPTQAVVLWCRVDSGCGRRKGSSLPFLPIS